jgi:AraC family ethanolamine operon transcriptional activator
MAPSGAEFRSSGPAVDSRELEDVDAMASVIADGIESEYVQLEAKPFSGHWTIVRLRSMVIQFAREDVALVRRLRVPQDRWMFVVPLHVPGLARWNGHAIRGGELIVCPAGGEGYAFDPGGMRSAIISVDASSAAEMIHDPGTLPAVDGSCVLRPPATDMSGLRRRLAELGATAEAATGWNAPAGTSRACDMIVERLSKCLHGGLLDRQDANSGARSRVVRSAEQFFRCHVGEPVSIAQLSAIAGVSERSLRNAFYHVCTTSPKRYLKILQLHQVRRALRGGARTASSVTDVATLHGFFELGRFAGEYKALFGEAPSQTLQRTRTTGGAATCASVA